ncbi:MAG: hypothetical protein ACK5EA_16240, partial [Planctomycetaceae bacterium]
IRYEDLVEENPSQPPCDHLSQYSYADFMDSNVYTPSIMSDPFDAILKHLPQDYPHDPRGRP